MPSPRCPRPATPYCLLSHLWTVCGQQATSLFPSLEILQGTASASWRDLVTAQGQPGHREGTSQGLDTVDQGGFQMPRPPLPSHLPLGQTHE